MNSDKIRSVLIIGCGWVGKKLGQQLAKNDCSVYGTTRSSANFSTFSELGIKPVKLELPAAKLSDIRIPLTDVVIISISPGRGSQREDYPRAIRQLSKVLAERNTQVILYSSTSAYGKSLNEVSELDAIPKISSNNTMLAAEGELLHKTPHAVILRLCGLYGEDRHPVRYMAGRKDIANGDAPVNLVHRDDVIQVTQNIIEKNISGEIFNVCSNCHPTRTEIYTLIADRLDMKKPTFQKGGSDSKLVSSKKLNNALKLPFLHPDPMGYLKG